MVVPAPPTYLGVGQKTPIRCRRSVFLPLWLPSLLNQYLCSSIHPPRLLFMPRPLCDSPLPPGLLHCCHPVVPAPGPVGGRSLRTMLSVGWASVALGGKVSSLAVGRPPEQRQVGRTQDATGDLVQEVGEADLVLQNLCLPVPVGPAWGGVRGAPQGGCLLIPPVQRASGRLEGGTVTTPAVIQQLLGP